VCSPEEWSSRPGTVGRARPGRRLEVDEVYGEALSQATGVGGLGERSPRRTHVWRDPALAEAAARTD